MTGLADLGPLAQLRAGRLPRRLVQLLAGLYLYGLSQALMVRGGVGLAPWDVLHSGLTRHLPIGFGAAVVAASFVVLLFWIPLRETPGVGTVANALLVGASADLSLRFVPTVHPAADRGVAQYAFMLAGVALCGLATAMYIGTQLGRGPPGRADDRAAPPHRAVAAGRPHRPGGRRGRGRAAARRQPRGRHGRLRAGDRADDPTAAAAVDRRSAGRRRASALGGD